MMTIKVYAKQSRQHSLRGKLPEIAVSLITNGAVVEIIIVRCYRSKYVQSAIAKQ